MYLSTSLAKFLKGSKLKRKDCILAEIFIPTQATNQPTCVY